MYIYTHLMIHNKSEAFLIDRYITFMTYIREFCCIRIIVLLLQLVFSQIINYHSRRLLIRSEMGTVIFQIYSWLFFLTVDQYMVSANCKEAGCEVSHQTILYALHFLFMVRWPQRSFSLKLQHKNKVKLTIRTLAVKILYLSKWADMEGNSLLCPCSNHTNSWLGLSIAYIRFVKVFMTNKAQS